MRLLDVHEVAAELNVPVGWCYKAMASGELPSIKLGKYRRVAREDLDAYLRAKR